MSNDKHDQGLIKSDEAGRQEFYRLAAVGTAVDRAALCVQPAPELDMPSGIDLITGRKTPTSTEVVIRITGPQELLGEVFYVDLHACHGGHLCYLQFVLHGDLHPVEGGLEGAHLGGVYGLQAILPPGSPCPGPLRTLTKNTGLWSKS